MGKLFLLLFATLPALGAPIDVYDGFDGPSP
jgi:hypothetical protein